MTVSELNAVVAEIDIAAPPETVFAYLVEPDKMVRWMGSRVQLEPRSGGTYAVDINAQARGRGTFLEVDPPSRVVFSFGWQDDAANPPGSGTVELTLTPDAGGTHVRLVHRGLQTPEVRDMHLEGWQHYLHRLAAVAEGRDPGPDPNANPAQRGA